MRVFGAIFIIIAVINHFIFNFLRFWNIYFLITVMLIDLKHAINGLSLISTTKSLSSYLGNKSRLQGQINGVVCFHNWQNFPVCLSKTMASNLGWFQRSISLIKDHFYKWLKHLTKDQLTTGLCRDLLRSEVEPRTSCTIC